MKEIKSTPAANLIMNKKDVRYLITFPVSMFLILGVSALFFSHLYFTHYYELEKQNRAEDQKFEQLFENVKSGKLQFTEDKWIEIIRGQRKAAAAEFQLSVPFIEFLQFIGWFSLILATCNVLVVLNVRDKIKKRENELVFEEQKK